MDAIVSKTRQVPDLREVHRLVSKMAINHRITERNIKIMSNWRRCCESMDAEAGLWATTCSQWVPFAGKGLQGSNPDWKVRYWEQYQGSTMLHGRSPEERGRGCMKGKDTYWALTQKNKRPLKEERRKVKALVPLQKNTQLVYYSHFTLGLKDRAKIGSFPENN